MLALAALLMAAACSHNGNDVSTVTDVQVSIDIENPSDAIPEDFIGLSFETGSVRINNAHTDGYFFSASNNQTLNIFNQLGIKHLRIGGGSVDTNPTVPTFADIDELFAFVRKSGVKVIYSFRLLNGDLDNEVKVAKYVWDNYKDCIECFAVGNEPDWNSYHKPDPEIKDYPTYLAKWKKFAYAIKSEIPEVKFTGPNTGSNYPVAGAKDTDFNGKSWTVNFAEDLKDSGLLYSLAQHNYVGQDAAKMKPEEMIPQIMSADWPEVQYPALYNATCLPVLNLGFDYRLQESNSFSSASDGGSNSFSTALFSLDYMHWWSEHKCSGVNFHNKQWVLNAPIGMDGNKNFFVNPVGYGIMAFKLGGKGNILPLELTNAAKRNITAYAVRNDEHIYVTLINKEYGEAGHDIKVKLNLNADFKSVKSLKLDTPGNNPYSREARLGGEHIESTSEWAGKWVTLSRNTDVITVGECSALILDIVVK